MSVDSTAASYPLVTSLAEVWIEIAVGITAPCAAASLPSRKCGLKFDKNYTVLTEREVTSLAEVWIEIGL